MKTVAEGRRVMRKERTQEAKRMEDVRRARITEGSSADGRGFWRVEALLDGTYGRQADGKRGLFAKVRWVGNNEGRGASWMDEWIHCSQLNRKLRQELSDMMRSKRETRGTGGEEVGYETATGQGRWPKRQRPHVTYSL